MVKWRQSPPWWNKFISSSLRRSALSVPLPWTIWLTQSAPSAFRAFVARSLRLHWRPLSILHWEAPNFGDGRNECRSSNDSPRIDFRWRKEGGRRDTEAEPRKAEGVSGGPAGRVHLVFRFPTFRQSGSVLVFCNFTPSCRENPLLRASSFEFRGLRTRGINC